MIANTNPPPESKPWETYWRNRIAEEISLERKNYEDNGIKDEYSVQMNIFSLCESIAKKKWLYKT
jgi:hypothetical protein